MLEGRFPSEDGARGTGSVIGGRPADPGPTGACAEAVPATPKAMNATPLHHFLIPASPSNGRGAEPLWEQTRRHIPALD